MRTVSLRLADLIKTVLPIGFVGENLHTKVIIDCKVVTDEYPNAVVSMTVQPPLGKPYPAIVVRDGDFVTWDVTDSDLVHEGNGELQLSFIVDEVIVKSYIGHTKVQRSLMPTGEIPDPIDDWITRADGILDSIPTQINTALEAAKESGEFDGFSPEVSVEEITGGHQVSITDAEGTNTFDVMDGTKGDPGDPGQGISSGGTTGQILQKKSNADYDTEWVNNDGGVQIDDNAGVGDTGVTWSANKSVTEIAAKYTKPASGIPASDLASGVIPDISGKADLDENGKVPASQLPSYVDDVVEYSSLSAFPATGESGKIYIALDTNKTYRWSGSSYVAISSDLALGETSSTAYRGDRGAAAYAASVTNVESAPSSGSSNLITSGAVYSGLDDKADKTDTVLLTSLSLGRKADTTVGTKSVATGDDVTASGAYSHAEGSGTNASAAQAHAEGGGTTASEANSHAEGGGTTASGQCSHAEGGGTNASAAQAHAEGGGTTASGVNSHAEGANTTASGAQAHAEGSNTNASYTNAHAEGGYTSASLDCAHAEGYYTRASGSNSHAEGVNTYAAGANSHAEGYGYSNSSTTYGALGKADHSEGYRTKANSGSNSSYYGAHAEGYYTESTSRATHAEGYYSKATSSDAHAEGNNTRAYGNATHAEGQYTYASGAYSHAEGWGYSSSSTAYGALGTADHSEGYQTKANSGYAYAAHAEGQNTSATAGGAHAEGVGTTASGSSSHSEGTSTTATGNYSHAEGYSTTASGQQSHAEGYYSKATGPACHAEGYGTEANSSQLVGGQHVFGTYNFPIATKQITITAGGGETWEQHKAYKAYSCYFEVTDGGVTTYYVPHLNVPAYIDPTLDYAQGFWHTYTLPSGTSMSSIPEWDRDTLYPQNSTVKVLLYDGTYQAFQNHVAITTTYVPFTSSTYYHTQSVGTSFGQFQNILEIVGNGTTSNSWSKSNARTLDTDGNERLMGDLYVHCDKYSEGGTKVAKITDVEDQIIIDSTQPQSTSNKLWIDDSSGTEVSVPTYAEMTTGLAGKVSDVQVDGTSVVNNGVANIPVASTSAFGVLKVGEASSGLQPDSSGYLKIASSNSSRAKAGTETYRPLTPSIQHESTFFGLAKAAGADMASISDTTVGTYPDAQKIAIQKMLGIYEPPYVLLNDVTVNERTCFDFTTDSDGTPYNLLSVFIEVFYAADLVSESSGYGRYQFYDSNGYFLTAETGRYATNTSACYKMLEIVKRNNFKEMNYTRQNTVGNYATWCIKSGIQSVNIGGSNRGGYSSDIGNITRIAMNTNDAEPAGTRIKIWGQWAY